MATSKKATKTAAAKKATKAATKAAAPATKTAAKAATKVATKAATKRATKTTTAIKPIKDTFTKATLATYLAQQTELDTKTVKTVLAALENTILGSVHKRGAGTFTLPGLLKISVQQVPAKKRRFGRDPFTGEERWFDAKPASVRVKARALKKLKDAAQ